MPPQMMNGMQSQQMHPGLQPLMQPNGGMLQRPREGPDGEPAAKRPRVALGSNQGTSLLEAFSADEIRTHLTMLRSRPGPISACCIVQSVTGLHLPSVVERGSSMLHSLLCGECAARADAPQQEVSPGMCAL